MKSMGGWLFALAFLVLPNCGLPDGTGDPGGCEGECCEGDCGPDVTTNLKPGDKPWDGAIFCDVEDMNTPRRCVTQNEIEGITGVKRSHAAVDLVFLSGDSKSVLDYSDATRTAQGCTTDQIAVLITYLSPFPTGQEACLNCSQAISGPGETFYADVSAACVDLCRDMNGGGSDDFCAASDHAKAATNDDQCYDGACDDGDPVSGWPDPRKTPEPVVWDLPATGSVSASGPNSNTLQRDKDTTQPDPGLFDAGAASIQTIDAGDGYVEFTADDIDTARVGGLSQGSTDSDETDADIDFGIRLSSGGHVLISEKATLVVPPDGNPNFWFADYVVGDHFRVTVTANPDGTTANIEYHKLDMSCVSPSCPTTKLRPADGDPPIVGTYPFRVDASIREKNATLSDVVIVRIKK